MEQAHALSGVLESLRDRALTLSIGLFSGYSETELNRGMYRSRSMDSSEQKLNLWRRIRQQLDFAVLGRYNHRQPSDDPLVTSRNQVLRLYSERYSLTDFEPQGIEISIDASGLTQITGFPARGSLSGITQG